MDDTQDLIAPSHLHNEQFPFLVCIVIYKMNELHALFVDK